MFSKIIVLCTGNICRSPMAEALLRQRLGGKIEVSSAGTGALVGEPADPLALELMAEHGLDISAHRARQATQPLLTAIDLILCLDQTHINWVRMQYPQLQGRTHKLGRWPENADVPDPYRKPRSAFELAYTLCSQGVDEWIKRLG